MGRHEFATQFQLAYRRLWLVAAGIVRDRTEADDIVQEAAVVAFRKLDEFQDGTNFAAWVTEIVKRCASNSKRKASRRRTYPTDPNSLDQQTDPRDGGGFVDTSSGLSAMQSEVDDEMFQLLSELSAEARCCLLLRVVEELSYAEIASCLAIPEGTAMSHVHRSKRLIRRRYDHPSKKEGHG